jgi:hypothetical protein
VKGKVGQTLTSTVDATTVVVVRWPDADVELSCGGAAMVEGKTVEPNGSPDPALSAGTLLGKRYADDEVGVELLCTKAGTGTLTLNGVALPIKAAKPLPASD